MNTPKIVFFTLVCFLTIKFNLNALEIKVINNNWTASTDTYQAYSKNGYLNSLKASGKEFLAQNKVPGGSYLCHGTIPPLEKIKMIGKNTIIGENKFGSVEYKFTENDLSCTFNNKFNKTVAFYFILNQNINTVIVNGSGMLEVPAKTSGNSFKWIHGQSSMEFESKASIWGPWNGFQVYQIKPKNGTSTTIKIIPGKVMDTASFNKQTKTTGQITIFDYLATDKSKQIPLCMIGDSITWAGNGDYWRKALLKRMPNLAFIGTHSAKYGLSHAGEGGDSTERVLNRIKYIPDCPYYSLLIGTNNNSVKTKDKIKPQAEKTATNIIKIVNALCEKKGVQKVFLSSLLPCFTKNPLRDECNSETNKILRAQFTKSFPSNKVVWIEYEKPLRKIKGWEQKILLHPTLEGYDLIADIMTQAITNTLNVKPGECLIKPKNSGVRIVNLMDKKLTTVCPIIAGWYTLSFKVDATSGANPQVVLQGVDPNKKLPFKLVIPIKGTGRVVKNFFTKYERYNYSRDYLKLTPANCKVSEILLEKSRPSMKASCYGEDSYIDTTSPTMPGELLEYTK